MVMLLYTMAGLQKLVAVYTQATAGQINPFSMNAFAYQIADWLPQLQTEALLAPFIIYHPVWGWLPYIALIFLQFFSLWVMVRTSLQKVWAFCLVIFHIATYFTMGISFHPLVILDIILFFNSPFVPERLSLRQFVFDLPVLGQVLEWFARRKTKRA